ncbi:MAG: hypothetical protein AAGH79_03695 [Bacteroidota bacterium]
MLKNLKSLFIIEEENPKGKKPAPKKSASAKNTPPAKSPVIPESASGEPGSVKTKFVEILFSAMEKANLDGFDYLEYKQSLKSLEKMPMDEATRFQSAFAMAQTMGATPEHLLKTAQHYIDTLRQEEQKFEAALAKRQQEQIGSKESKIQKLEETVKAKAAQIKQLTQEMEAHQKEASQLQKQITTASAKVESTKNDFIASYNALIKQIGGDVENIKKYLK